MVAEGSQPHRGCGHLGGGRHRGHNPVGVEETTRHNIPRVGSLTRQPWALGHNPLGIAKEIEKTRRMLELRARIGYKNPSTMRYSSIIEHGLENFSAYAPDFPGCVAAADTETQTIALMKEALEMHIKDMRERSEPIPQSSKVREVEVAAI